MFDAEQDDRVDESAPGYIIPFRDKNLTVHDSDVLSVVLYGIGLSLRSNALRFNAKSVSINTGHCDSCVIGTMLD